MIETTTAQTAAQAEGTIQIVDVREDFEVAAGMIPGAAHIPMGEILGRLGELDRSRPIHVVCAAGGRSGRVAEALEAEGFDVFSMAGGMGQWQAEGRPVVLPGQSA